MAAASADPQSSPKPALLVVVGEAHTDEQKDLILQRIIKELSSWDNGQSGVDLDAELQVLAAKAPVAEDGQIGEKIIDHESDVARIVILVNPNVKTLSSRLRSFFLLPGTYHHLIYSGLSIRGSGCWLVQDGFYTASSFADLLRSTELCAAVKQGTVSGTIAINVLAGGEWTESHLSRAVSSPLTIQVNRESQSSAASGFVQFGGYLSSLVQVVKLSELLPASGVVGNIRFSRPTIYIFPGGQGDSALFGVSGFNLLVDGGYARRSCFWDFTRHLDRIDAMLVSHIGPDNIFGLSSIAERKAHDAVHPEIGHVFMNAVETPMRSGENNASESGSGKTTSLLVSLGDEASSLVENMKKGGLVLNKCLAGTATASGFPAINLYHKVGHGSLDLYVLSPSGENRALKEFFTQWSRHGNGFKAQGGSIPLSNQSSVCSLLVWKPSAPTDTVTRIFFPGTAPQATVLEALDKMKNVVIFQHAVYSEKDVSSKSAGGAAKKQPPKPASHAAPAPQSKPVSLPTAASKPDKPELKNGKKTHPPISKPGKETGKVSSPTKPQVKESKVDAKAHVEESPQSDAQQPPAESPSSLGERHEEVVASTPESPGAAEEAVVDHAEVADAEVADPIVDLTNVADEPVADTQHAAAQDNAVVDDLLGDLQAVPEPNLLSDGSPVVDYDVRNQEIVDHRENGQSADDHMQHGIVKSDAQREPVNEETQHPYFNTAVESAEQSGVSYSAPVLAEPPLSSDFDTAVDSVEKNDLSLCPAELVKTHLQSDSDAAVELVEESGMPAEASVPCDVGLTTEHEADVIPLETEPAQQEPMTADSSSSEQFEAQCSDTVPATDSIPVDVAAASPLEHSMQKDVTSEGISSPDLPVPASVCEALEQQEEVTSEGISSPDQPVPASVCDAPEQQEHVEEVPSDAKPLDNLDAPAPEPEPFIEPASNEDQHSAGNIVAHELEADNVLASEKANDEPECVPDHPFINAAAESVFKEEIAGVTVDNDKDIDTAEEPTTPASVVPVTPDCDHGIDDVAVQVPPDVVAGTMPRSDSLDAMNAEFSKNAGTVHETGQPAEDVNTFNMLDLKSVPDEESNTNPFVGITGNVEPSVSGEALNAFQTADLSSFQAADNMSANPFSADAQSHFAASHEQDHELLDEIRHERDSLERDVAQPQHFEGDEFDPLIAWDKPSGLPAPNKLPGAKNEAAGNDKKSDSKKATSPTKPLSKPPQSAGAKYHGKEEAEGAGGDNKHSSAAGVKKAGKPTAAAADAAKNAVRTQPAKKPASGAAPVKAQLKPVVPFYVDLAYIPAHGAAEYVDLEFFRRVRARYYVLSTISPDPATLGALVEAKSTWDDPDVPVTIIPTYDADVLRYWMAAHRDQLGQLRIDVAPAAIRCTIQLQDHDAGCAAFRLEF